MSKINYALLATIAIILLFTLFQIGNNTDDLSLNSNPQTGIIQATIVEDNKMAEGIRDVSGTKALGTKEGDLEFRGKWPMEVIGDGSTVEIYAIESLPEKDIDDLRISVRIEIEKGKEKQIEAMVYDTSGHPSDSEPLTIRESGNFSIDVQKLDMKGAPDQVAFKLT